MRPFFRMQTVCSISEISTFDTRAHTHVDQLTKKGIQRVAHENTNFYLKLSAPIHISSNDFHFNEC